MARIPAHHVRTAATPDAVMRVIKKPSESSIMLRRRTQYDIFQLDAIINKFKPKWLGELAATAAERVLCLDQLNDIYRRVMQRPAPESFVDRVLAEFDIHIELDRDLANIPATGPVVVVANHPFGGLEGVILLSLLKQVRPDVKLMANSLLGVIPQLREHMIFVNPFNNASSRSENIRGLRESVSWLKEGGLLGVFPAGAVSSLDPKVGKVTDPPWSSTIARLVRTAEATVVPVHISGANGLPFHLLGLLHPNLRTAQLPREMLNKRGQTVRLSIGNRLKFAKLAKHSDDEALIKYLRRRTDLLAARAKAIADRQKKRPIFLPKPKPAAVVPVASAVPVHLLEQDIAALGETHLTLKSHAMEVYTAPAARIPHVLQEIGRLREITFRAAGEGTNLAADLDPFDRYYQHLFLWNSAKRELVGAYRLGQADLIVPKFGLKGLYTHTLFDFRRSFLNQLQPAVEVGRSFVRIEYQKSYNPLMLLWRGIGTFLANNPHYRTLFGPVSISNNYSHASRSLMVEFFRRQAEGDTQLRGIRPRTPFVPKPVRNAQSLLHPELIPRDLDELGSVVSDLESDGKGLPVLLRHYLRVGAKIAAFNLDPQFANALDGLIILDITKSQEAIAPYMPSAT